MIPERVRNELIGGDYHCIDCNNKQIVEIIEHNDAYVVHCVICKQPLLIKYKDKLPDDQKKLF